MSNSNALLRADQDARAAALDIQRSFLVQAPAGAGKTELLIQRYLRLLSIVENPEEILAITFTRKAAAEMQLRVLDALKNAANGCIATEAHERITLDAALAALQRDRELAWNLIANPRRMRIQTLDSLCASIVRMRPVSASGNAHYSVASDMALDSLYRSAAALTLDHLALDGTNKEAIETMLLHVDNSVSLYVAYIARMLATRDQWLPFIGSGLLSAHEQVLLRVRLENNLAAAIEDHLRRTCDAIPAEYAAEIISSARHAAQQLLAAGQGTSAIASLADLQDLPEPSVAASAQWRGLATLLLTQQGAWRKSLNKNQGFPPTGKAQKQSVLDLLTALATAHDFRELLHGVQELPPAHYDDEQWGVLVALFRLLPLAVVELRNLFSEQGTTDYVEIALGAATALGTDDDPGDIALLLDYQLRHVLVDEMQDTSSSQYRMLEALTGGWESDDGRTLFCVGDPMQSIYRFRNAEVGQFLLAQISGIGQVPLQTLTLRRNFRSGATLVEWFNEVFPHVLAAHDDAARSAVAYSAAASIPERLDQAHCCVHPVIGSDPQLEARLGCKLIQETLAKHRHDNMAVLVRSRSQLRELLAALRAAHVSYQALEIDRLTDLPEIIDVLALTRALSHRGDRAAWLAVLRAPWVGLDWQDLHTLVWSSRQKTVWELLHDEPRLAQLSERGRQAILHLRMCLQAELRPNRVDYLRDRVEKTWLRLGGGAILQDKHAVENVYRFLEVLEGIERGGSLHDVAALESALDLIRVSSDSGARLQVMTMHRAKGLQFDHVLLFGLGRVPARRENRVLSWFDIPAAHGASKKVMSPIGPRTALERDPIHRFIEKVEAEKDRFEHGRLLYVACTRARKGLHLMGHVDLPGEEHKQNTPASGSLLKLLWPAVEQDFSRAATNHATPERGATSSPWLIPNLRYFSQQFELPQFNFPKSSESTNQQSALQTPVDFYWVGEEARLAGTVVHRWLQLAVRLGIDHITADKARVRSTTREWLRQMGIGTEVAQSVSRRVEMALQNMLTDEKGRWLLSGAGEAELAITGVYAGELVSVVIDRVRIDEYGTHWIVDYKTSTHEGGRLGEFLRAESDRYRAQLQRYQQLYAAYAQADTRCALYFPLLQRFVEVDL